MEGLTEAKRQQILESYLINEEEGTAVCLHCMTAKFNLGMAFNALTLAVFIKILNCLKAH